MIIPENFFQANYRFTGTGLPHGAEITMGYAMLPLETRTPVEFAEALFDAWGANMRPLYSADVSLTSVLVKFGPNDTGPSGIDTGAFVGTGSGTPDSPNVAMLIRKNTAFGGHAGRGRLYVPGIPTSAVNTNGTTSPAAFQTQVNSWFAAQQALDVIPVLLHGPGSPLVVPTPITSLTVDGTVATQRRRLRR